MITGAEIGALAPTLERRPPGIWFARRQAAVSYPAGGNAACLQVEDSSFWFRHRNRCIVNLVRRFRPLGPLLDVGGGNGYVARGLQQAGVDCVLVEPGVEGALAAHTRGVANVICARLEDAGLPSGSFAAIGLFDVLEHLEDDAAALGAIHDLLAPNGYLFVTVPAFQALFSAEDVAAGHHRRYSAARLKRSLRQAGFEIEYLSYLFWPLPLPVFLFRVLPTWFGRRPSEEPELTASEHSLDGLGARLMDRALQWEYDVVARGGRMLFGGSCLAVARRGSGPAAG
jgi:SAM-dependent methyltransferase